ncbi:hypothetical protein GCM10022224_057010 [Nonomuraea antimicrobica]|uniref:Uncharacterized protein n=1 Tax=Nonomuraea antimicrobica TaxID=561173 RepID=A0ABP7CDC2_9ACTN
MGAIDVKTVEDWQAASPWQIYHDQETGASLPVPPGWEGLLYPEVRIALRQPGSGPGFRPNVTLTVERPPKELSELPDYSQALLQAMALTLTDLTVISIDQYERWGVEGRRVLSAYRSGIYALALEQYWFLKDDLVTSMSGTCAVEQHDELAETFEYIVAGTGLASRLPDE